MAELAYKYHKTENVSWRLLAQEGIIFDADHDQLHSLAGTAVRIWELLDGTRTLKQLVDIICTEYQVEREVAVADTQELVDQLLEKRLVQIVS